MVEGPFKGEMILGDGEERAHIPDLSRPMLEALFTAITRTQDSISRERRSASVIGIEDVQTLVDQIYQWTQPYDPISRNIKITIRLIPEDRSQGIRRIEFNGLEEFQRELPGYTERVTAFFLEFNFLSRAEDGTSVHRLEGVAEFRGDIRRIFYNISEDNQVGGRIYHGSDHYSAKFSIKYSDVIIARSLMGLLNEWYDGLPKRQFPPIGRLRKFLHQHDYFETLEPFNLVIIFSSIFFGSIFALPIVAFLQGYAELGSGIVSVLPIIVFTSGATILFFGWSLFKFRKSEVAYKVPLIEITSGDKRRREAFSKRLEASEKKSDFWTRNIFFGFVISLLASAVIAIVQAGAIGGG